MREETIKVYTVDELDKEATERVIEKYRDINLNHEWWKYNEEEIRKEAEKLGFIPKDGFYFSLFGQGNYLELEVDIADDMVNGYSIYAGLWNKKAIRDSSWSLPEIRIDEVYNEEEERYIEPDEEDKEEWKEVAEEIESRVAELADYLKEQKKRLSEEYMIRQEPEQILETVRINDMEFLEDGRNYWSS